MNYGNGKYDIVVGLEVHIQLTTNSKLFCSDAAFFGAAANENISAITLGHPGTLPRINEKAIVQAVKLGLALECSITQNNFFSRKHYLYPDLPKGFQTTQHIHPVCEGGLMQILVHDQWKKIILDHIHLEEDAGKSIHDASREFTAIDFNRAGTPLCELVTTPCISNSEEAAVFLTELRKLIRWIGVSDGNMEEGSLRCDANISVKPTGTSLLGTRVEVKNLNSIKFVKKAIDLEAARLIGILENNGVVQQETRSFDANTETTFTLRTKEDAHDYRYFFEPDLSPVTITNELINQIKLEMPALPMALQQELISSYGFSGYDAMLLTEDQQTVQFFKEAVEHDHNAKSIANFINGPVRNYCRERHCSITDIKLKPKNLAAMVKIVEAGIVDFNTAGTKLFPALLNEPETDPMQLVTRLGLELHTDKNEIEDWIQTVLQKFPEKVAAYKKGKKGLLGFFTGEVVKLSKGKAAPKNTQELLMKQLQ
jgi:aspartyl-tRNA(Asn)/glutamyl-tRNA(Gln) amidotransferase subunit B